MNIGAILFAFLIGVFRAKGETRLFYAPLFILFLAGNLIRFQPWEWDNYKIFLQWYVLTVIIAAYGLIELKNLKIETKRLGRVIAVPERLRCRFAHIFERLARSLSKMPVGKLVFVFLLVLCILAGALNHVKTLEVSYAMWSRSDMEVADWTKNNTNPDSLFLTSDSHLHPINCLAGRRIVVGPESWLWSHGVALDKIQSLKSDVMKMYEGDFSLIKKYGIDFVSIGPYEEWFSADNNFIINLEVFNDPQLFNKVFDETIDGDHWTIYEVF